MAFGDDAAESDDLVRIEHNQNPIVVWIRGEHDYFSAWAIWSGMAQAIASSDADVVADLSAVEFMSVSTVSVFMRARESLREQSRRFIVRAPSHPARRVFEVAHLLDLLDDTA